MTIRYLSLFSGIEAASLAWEPLGWEPMAFCEIEPFPSAVLAARWPDVPNLGDVTGVDWEGWLAENGTPDVVIAGSPCQAFSVAGNRRSLEDARGNLTLFTAELVRLIDPRLFLWENVPGALSTRDNAFGCLLGELVGAGEPLKPTGKRWTNSGLVSGPEAKIAWRVLDAQYFGVPQRRNRLFAARCPRGGADPAEVLLIEPGMPRYSPPSRQERTDAASRPASGPGSRGVLADSGVVRGLKARFGTSGSDLDDAEAGHLVPSGFQAKRGQNSDTAYTEDGTPPLSAEGSVAAVTGPWWDGSDVSETIDCSRVLKQQTMPDKARFAAVLEQTPWVKCPSCDDYLCTVHGVHAHDCPCPDIDTWAAHELNPYFPCDQGKVAAMLEQEGIVAFSCKDSGADAGEVSPPLRAMNYDESHANAGGQVAIGFYPTGGTHGVSAVEDGSPAIKVGSGLGIPSSPAIAFQLSGNRDDPSVSTSEDTAYCLPANPMSDRAQAVAYGFRSKSNGNDRDPLTEDGSPAVMGQNPPAVAFKASHYTRGKDGAPSETYPPLSADADKGDQDPLVLAYRKSQRAHSSEDCETWVDDDVANTLNAFEDHCDARATHAVVAPMGGQAVAFDGYNQSLSDSAQSVRSGKSDGDHVGMVVFTSDGETADPIAANEQRTYTNEGGHNFRMHNVVGEPKQVQWTSGGGQLENDTAQALRANAEHSYQFMRYGMAVRRLTPRECERLQGMPDDHTMIAWRGKPAEECPDGPRYRAIGNSMAVPVIRWIGRQIERVLAVRGH